jgi:endonuclease III
MPDSPRRKTQQLIERAAFVRKTLQAYYPNPPIPLIHHDPFTLCIAVLLSAHTTDKSVNKVTPELFRRAPNPVAMAELGEKAILEIIRPVGLAPTKSRNVHALALKLLREFDGRLPQTLEELESLPGVGHKTASVVMCQAYGQPAFPVDTHIHRLAERWNLSSGRSVEQTETDLKSLFEAREWAKLHLQMIYFGREHCPARNHLVEKCPICGPLQDGSWRPKKD